MRARIISCVHALRAPSSRKVVFAVSCTQGTQELFLDCVSGASVVACAGGRIKVFNL